jgi:GT2 family glycosyltransferase
MYERSLLIEVPVKEDSYVCDEITHIWHEHLIWKVADFKDRILERGRDMKYDYVFLVDSDLVLHPRTLTTLVSTGKDIISEIFWTRWRPGEPELPQVWLLDQYTLYWTVPGEKLTPAERSRRVNEFLSRLRKPGVYRVGGLGACTLISAKALSAGVSFRPLYNVTFWGEDRHFSLRAVALGFTLYVDTHFPAYHLYRESDLLGLATYKQAWASET